MESVLKQHGLEEQQITQWLTVHQLVHQIKEKLLKSNQLSQLKLQQRKKLQLLQQRL